jgi:enterochelin esterase-like enzyme
MPATGVRQYGGRTVWVHLPPGYDPNRLVPYPLLVLHDGQNLSARRTEALAGSWRADEAVDRLTNAGVIAPIVLAGIDHAGDNREDEFAPPTSRLSRSRQARAYSSLIHDEIIPGLARDVYVHTDPEGLAMGGSAMGALVALWMAAIYPGRFGRLLLMSPAVAWKRRVILRMLETNPVEPSTKVWVHAAPDDAGRHLRDARALCDRLRGTGCRTLRYVEDTDTRHNEESWAERLPEALAWLYGMPEA